MTAPSLLFQLITSLAGSVQSRTCAVMSVSFFGDHWGSAVT